MAKRTFKKENGVSVQVFIKIKSHTNDTTVLLGSTNLGQHLLLSKTIKFLFIISKVLQILIGERLNTFVWKDNL